MVFVRNDSGTNLIGVRPLRLGDAGLCGDGTRPDLDMCDDPSEARLRQLEEAIADMADQAQAAKVALCENELIIRLDNIIRRAEAVGTRKG